MKKIALGIILSALVVSAGYCQVSKQPLKLVIKSDKKVYLAGQTVYIEYKIENIGDKEVYIVKPFGPSDEAIYPFEFPGRFSIKEQAGKELYEPSIAALIDWAWHNKDYAFFATIPPGKSYVVKIDISLGMKKNHFLASPLAEEPGKYTITGIYQPKHWFGNELPVWEGRLISNAIAIEITKRKTPIDKEKAIGIAREYAAKELGKDLKIYQEPTATFNKENNTWDVSFKMEPMPPGGWFDIIIDAETGSILQYSPGI